jgi:hypothetical protein
MIWKMAGSSRVRSEQAGGSKGSRNKLAIAVVGKHKTPTLQDIELGRYPDADAAHQLHLRNGKLLSKPSLGGSVRSAG